MKRQITFMKKYRSVLQFGSFYRLESPFEGNVTAWMSVSGDRKTAVVGWYRTLNGINMGYTRVKLRGLEPDSVYRVSADGGLRGEYYGDELMNVGLVTSDADSGELLPGMRPSCDFDSRIFVLEK